MNFENKKRQERPKPFHFEPMWILDDRFLGVVRMVWPRIDIALTKKIDCTRDALIDWNHNGFGNVYARKKTC